ncbi:MAG: ATP-binding domain-containing protein, partial [Acidobacteria bacterium]|nr:ATP-binding domain-containing protein [Acidobacteriota bacterium]
SPTERPHRIRLRVWTKHGTYARYEAGTICWNECDAIERNPDRMRGAWRFKGTGVPLANLFHALAAGSTTTELVETNDGVEETAPATVLEFIAEQLDDAKEALWRYGGPRTATPPLLDGGKENRDAEHDPKTTHWKDCGAAWRDAERMTGSWCIKDTRFPLSQLFTNLADEESVRELDTLMPAYAATVHKSQGSEYPAVVIPVLIQNYVMLQRNLLYTALTRGKRLVVLVGQKKAVAMAVRNAAGRKRWSKLRERLQALATGKTEETLSPASAPERRRDGDEMQRGLFVPGPAAT